MPDKRDHLEGGPVFYFIPEAKKKYRLICVEDQTHSSVSTINRQIFAGSNLS